MNYKKYSLEKLQEWVHDALSCGEASPHEIYSAIREIVQEDYQHYKDHAARAFGLLELLSGHRPVADDELYRAAVAEREYYEGKDDGMRPWGHSDMEYLIANRKESLTCDKDDPSPECQKSWNDFWEENYYPEEYAKGKVKKWVLPVQQSVIDGTDDYYVNFPNDLLEAADLKEGDMIEWVDQGDGSYRLEKITKPLGMDEC